MPPEVYPSFAMNDVLTLVGIIVTICVQSFAAIRWIGKRFDQRDEELQQSNAAHERSVVQLAQRVGDVREFARGEVAQLRQDTQRDIASLRERLAVMPSRRELDQALRERVAPLEHDLRQLVVELARLGLHMNDGDRK